MQIKISRAQWERMGKQAGWSNNIDKNTTLIGKIKNVPEAKKICVEKVGHLPPAGYESWIDKGEFDNNGVTVPYRTYLTNDSGSFRVWTWIGVMPSKRSTT